MRAAEDASRGPLRLLYNYAVSLLKVKCFEEAKSLLLKVIPVARRVLVQNNDLTLKMRWNYARALYYDAGATLDDLREAVTTLEDAERTARRVLGGAHPTTVGIEEELRAAFRARETALAEALAGMRVADERVV